MTSIDSKDPIIANTWMETILDAIDLLPVDVIKQEVILIAVSKAQPEQSASAKKLAAKILGKVASKLDRATIRRDILPSVMSLFRDPEGSTRHCICQQLHLIARGLGSAETETILLPLILELSTDDNSKLRLAALESAVQMIGHFTSKTCTDSVLPMIIKICEKARLGEDETLPKIVHHFGRVCHAVINFLTSEQKDWFVNFFIQL